MANTKVSKSAALKIIQSVIVIIVGVLIACAVINTDFIKYVVGIAFLVLGAFLLFRSVYDTKSFIMPYGVFGGTLIGVGIATMVDYIPLLMIIRNFIYVSLIVLGALLILDGIVRLALGKTNNGIVELIIGAILVTVGGLFIGIPEMSEYCWIAFGVVVALYGVYTLIVTIIQISKK